MSGSTEGPAAGTVSGGTSSSSSLFSSTSSLTDEEEDGDGGATSASSRPDRVLPGVVGVGNGADGRGRRRDGRRAALRALSTMLEDLPALRYNIQASSLAMIRIILYIIPSGY